MAHFGVLGPLAIEGPPGHWVALRGERQRTLLAVLLVNANQHVHVDVLVEALWPGGPPKSHTSNLHTYLSRLRERIDGLRVEHGPLGYRLHVEPGELDLLVFRAAVADGKRAGDAVAAAGHYRRALAQWRGPVLAG
ncbi:winged helix-turn-helix domain-containing protein, partial [Amycolatopsis sp. SID8362]|uniref:AfsR/SARP family transcriptional regulator n=1 Tax=Amycolatopsis sp. SID8362 TaxID=2690346 RepID=UPI00142CD9DE